MNNILRISSCLCLLVLFSVLYCSAQKKIVISEDPPPALLNLPVVKEVGEAKVLYNERTDKTIIETAPTEVYGDSNNGVRLRAKFEVSGRTVAKPSEVTLVFYSIAPKRTYADNRALKISIDGKETFSGTARYESGNTNGSIFVITVSQNISYEMYLRLINSKSVKMQIGPAQFELKESNLDALKDLKRVIE
jgi:hypothetical protein